MTEGAGGAPVELGAQLSAAAVAPVEQQRSLVEAALVGNADARAKLLSSHETLPEIKAALGTASASNPAAIARARRALDIAEQQARADGARIGQAVTAAVKTAFTTSVTRIYLFAIPLSAVALVVIVLWLPELPLSPRRHHEANTGE